MAITDLANNPIQAGGITGQMLGYIEPPAPGEELTLEMYDFLINPIRDRDAKEGNLFVKRFLMGAQQIWEDTQASIFAIKDLWSVTDCPDEYLQYLKNIVGWTIELDHITSGLDNDELRRLIHASIPLWKSRSNRDAIMDVINLMFSRRSMVWNWFDHRWISGSTLPPATVLAEQRQGRDPYLLAFPADDAEYWSTIRVVKPDDATLLINVLNLLMRPISEKFRVIYLDFLDRFNIEDDLSQWSNLGGSELPSVTNGALSLSASAAEYVYVNIEDAGDWDEYTVSGRLRGAQSGSSGSGYRLLFLLDADTVDGYAVRLDIAANQIVLEKITSGSFSTVSYFDLGSWSYILQDNIWYLLRVEIISNGSAGIWIKVHFNGDLAITREEITPQSLQGAIGIGHTSDATVKCDEIEVMGLPVDSETIEPS